MAAQRIGGIAVREEFDVRLTPFRVRSPHPEQLSNQVASRARGLVNSPETAVENSTA